MSTPDTSPEKSVLLTQVKDLIKGRGLKLGDAAQVMGIDASKLSKILGGDRKPRFVEVTKLASALKIPARELMEIFGVDYEWVGGHSKVVTGLVVHDDSVQIYPENFAPYQIGLSLVGLDTIVRINTVAFAPRYFSGEHLTFLENELSPKHLNWVEISAHFGSDAVVQTTDGNLHLKKIFPGSHPRRYTLVSLRHGVAPMLDVEVEWVAPIHLHIPGRPYRAWDKGPLDDLEPPDTEN